MKEINEKLEYFYSAFRIIIGALFLFHGIVKFQIGVSGLFLAAGIIEAFVGILLIIGYMSRYVATLGAIEMIFAWFIAHVSKGWNPLVNGGEPALLFFAAFLGVIAYGSGKFSLKKYEFF